MPSLSLSKRSACDRCRSMKLRCPPRSDNTLSCGRCLRLKVNCVSSPPRDSSKAAPQSISLSQAMPTAASKSKRSEWSPRPNEHLHRHSIELDKWSWLGPPESQRQIQDDIPAVSACPSFEVPSASLFEAPEDFTSFIDSERHESTSVDFESCDFAYSEDSPTGADESLIKVLPVNPFSAPSINDFGPSYFPEAQTSSSRIESDTRLSSLRLSLSKRCQQYQYHSAASPEALSSPASPIDDDIERSNSTGSSWFGGALRDISKFLSIIEVYSRGISTPADRQNGSTRGSAIGVVIALDILSAYLQIISIFDKLCAQLYEKLRSSSHASASRLQILPGLQLAGLSVEHGHLQTKILIQAVVHHFEMIERVLGLPAIYRVSDRLDTYTGLLESNKQWEKLVAAVMEDECGNRTLNSLKQNLEKMEQLINR